MRWRDSDIPKCSICRAYLHSEELTEPHCAECRARILAQDDAAIVREQTGVRVRWQDVRDFGRLVALERARTSWLDSLGDGTLVPPPGSRPD